MGIGRIVAPAAENLGDAKDEQSNRKAMKMRISTVMAGNRFPERSRVLLSIFGLILGFGQAAQAADFKNCQPMSVPRHVHAAALLFDGRVLVVGGSSGTQVLATAESYNPATGLWSPAGSMSHARSYPTATTLRDGRVLVLGGLDASGTTRATADLFDPVTNQWTAAEPMPTARAAHSATLLANGKVLVAGGSIGPNSVATCVLYDPSTGHWSSTGSMSVATHAHAAVRLPEGKVLVVGGTIGQSVHAKCEIYDPATGTWSTTGSLVTKRRYSSAVLLPNGKVLTAGGESVLGSYLNSAELYNPATGTWTQTSSMRASKRYHTLTLLPNGKVLAAGGQGNTNIPEIFNPATNTWSDGGSMADVRFHHSAVVMANGKVLLAGGYNSAIVNATAEVYEPQNGVWTTDAPMSFGRGFHTMTLLPTGKVLVCGGSSGLASAELFDPESGVWSPTGDMTIGRVFHTATLLSNGKVLVTGGELNTSLPFTSCEIYDPATGTWAATGSMKRGRRNHTATLLNDGRILVAGGAGSDEVELYDPSTGLWSAAGYSIFSLSWHTATLLPNGKVLFVSHQGAQLYDPATGQWAITNPMGTPRNQHSATLLPNGKVLVAGGEWNGVLSSSEIYDPNSGLWTNAASMSGAVCRQSDVLLPNGKVLVIGGFSGYTRAELFDPAAGTWSLTASLATGRDWQRAVLLPNGKVMVSGGQGEFGGMLTSVEIFDTGLGYDTSWRPQISSIISALPQGGAVFFEGDKLQGFCGPTGGFYLDSSGGIPCVQLRSLENGQTMFLQPFDWSDDTYLSRVVVGMAPGWGMATVFTNGIPSVSAIFKIASPGTANLTGLSISSGTLAPSFETWRTDYTAEVIQTTAGISITPVVDAPTSFVSVRVNAGAFMPLASGSPGPALSLNFGVNLIELLVTADDMSFKTYSIAVTRLPPSLVVKNGEATINDGDSVPLNFGVGTRERASVISLTLLNEGTESIVLDSIQKDGPNAADFSVGLPASMELAPGASTTLSITFGAANQGSAVCAIHIQSNAPGGLNSYDIQLAGIGLGYASDSDGDGMFDAPEFNLAALGFDYLSFQPELVQTYYAGANSAGLFTQTQIRGLNVETPILTRNPATGKFKLTLRVAQSADLRHFYPFPMTAPQIGINGQGEVEFEFEAVADEQFYRVESR